MQMPENNTELSRRLREALGENLSVTLTDVLADLLWDRDTNRAEVERLGNAVCVEKVRCQRWVVLLLVRGELRFAVTTDRDPYATDSVWRLGVLPSIDAAITLCEEFIGRDIPIDDLSCAPGFLFL